MYEHKCQKLERTVGLKLPSVDTYGVLSSKDANRNHSCTPRAVMPPGPNATQKSEAQLLLRSVDAIQVDLRLYSAIKSSTSSLVFFLQRSHTRLKISWVEGEKSPNTFLILFSVQFIISLFTQGGVHT